MDPRLQKVVSQQQVVRFAGLAGTEAGATIRISDRLLNELIAAFVPPGGPLRSVVIVSHAGNRMDVALTLGKLAFLPAIPLTVVIERQPELPADPVLVLRLAGSAGHLMRLGGSALGLTDKVPPFVRMDGELLHVNLRGALEQRGQAPMLDHVQHLSVNTEQGSLVLQVAVRVS